MLQRIYPGPFSVELRKKDINDVIVLIEYKDDIELVCRDGYKKCCYLILAGLIVNYKEQVFITSI